MDKKPAKHPVVLTEHRKNFVNLLNQFNNHGYNRFNVFNDFLQMTAISLANNSDPYHFVTTEKTFLEREERYKRTVDKYKPALQEVFPKMFAELFQEIESYCPNNFTDVLGEIFHALEFQNEWNGQFFTTQSVCDMIGRMLASNGPIKNAIDDKGYVTVNEPCCGAGAMILGFANGTTLAGFNPQRQMLVIANDLDERCVAMCYIQLSLYGIPAIIQLQNTLTQEIFDAPWVTPMFVAGGWQILARKFFNDEQKTPIEIKPLPVINPTIEPQFGQMALF